MIRCWHFVCLLSKVTHQTLGRPKCGGFNQFDLDKATSKFLKNDSRITIMTTHQRFSY